MIGVNELLTLDSNTRVVHNRVSGILVLSGNNVLLIDENSNNEWDEASAIFIAHEDLKYALMLQIPIKHGAKSIFYNTAEVVGVITYKENVGLCISPESIFVETSKNNAWTSIDFGDSIIRKGKARYLDLGNDYFTALGIDPPNY